MSYAGKVWEMKEVRASWMATGGAANIQIKTDLPGAAMAVRKTLTLAVGTERKTDVFPCDGIEFRQLQPRYNPNAAGVLRMYKATAKVRPIGLYLDGAAGEYYETQPITLGAG